MEKEFKECKECSKKSGSPILCDSCYHNRTIVSELKIENDKLWKKLEIIQSVVEL